MILSAPAAGTRGGNLTHRGIGGAQEPLLLGIGAVHATLLCVALLTARRDGVQSAIFLVSGAAACGSAAFCAGRSLALTLPTRPPTPAAAAGLLVVLSERINALGARHWRAIATQNYFDKHGVHPPLCRAPLRSVPPRPPRPRRSAQPPQPRASEPAPPRGMPPRLGAGVFMASVWCAPLVLLLCGLLCGFIVRMTRLLARPSQTAHPPGPAPCARA